MFKDNYDEGCELCGLNDEILYKLDQLMVCKNCKDGFKTPKESRNRKFRENVKENNEK